MSIKCIEYDRSLDRASREGKRLGLWLYWQGMVGYRGDRVGVRGQVFVLLPEDIKRMFSDALTVKDRDEAIKILMEAGELNDMIHPMAPPHV